MKFQNKILTLLILLFVTTISMPAFAFNAKDFEGENWKLWILMPDTRVYEDLDPDQQGELDLTTNGTMTADVQLGVVDVFYPKGDWRFGLNAGIALPTVNDAKVKVISYGWFVQFKKIIRFEGGIMKARSFDESLTGDLKDDSARYIGFSFPFDLLGELGE